jgi:hypothetical protein
MMTKPILAFLACAALVAAPAPKPLEIQRLTLHQYEDGPPLAPSTGFGQGDLVFLSFQVDGFQQTPDREVHLAYRIEPADPKGVPLVEPLGRDLKTTLSAEDKDWRPIVRESFPLPPLTLPGVYRIAIAVEDKLASRQAKAELTYTVRGRNVEPGDTLTARNFRFLRAEDDAQPLEPPVYHPGQALWARFDIVGYKYGPKNMVRTSYGVSVLSPSGKTMYTEPQAAVEEGEAFYPKPYLPGVFSLNLGKDVRPGVYTIVLDVRDQVGDQSVASKHEFRVE